MTWRIYQHPSESNAEGEESVESIASPVDPTAQLQAEINTAKAEVAEWQDRFLRKAAEFENYRKRAEKEKMDSAILAKGSVLAEFLPIADACERALKTLNEARSAPGSLQQYQDGVELLYKQVLDALGRTGVTPMTTEGKRFDPHLHEALLREEASEFEEGMIVKELRRGYLFKDKLLRPAQVVVSIKGKDRTSQ